MLGVLQVVTGDVLQVVTGDVLVVAKGDRVPAVCRVLKAQILRIHPLPYSPEMMHMTALLTSQWSCVVGLTCSYPNVV